MGKYMNAAGSFDSLVFNTNRSGTFYALVDYLVLSANQEELKIPFPCQISVNGRKKVVITEVDGLIDTVKEDMGFSGYDLNISFEVGDYGVLPWMQDEAGSLPKASELITKLANLVRNYRGCVGITEGAQIRYEHSPGQFTPTINEVAAALDDEIPQPEVKQPLLASLEIRKIVLQSISVNPVKNYRYKVSLTAVAEMDEDADLFPGKAIKKESGASPTVTFDASSGPN